MIQILQEYRASDWKIAEIDPDTSGKYVFDFMTYAPGRCENCGHPIKWNVHIHDAEDPSKKFVVGDDCIEFLLAIRGGLENTEDLDLFREAKSALVRFFHWLFKHHIDTADLNNVVGLVDNADKSGVTFLPISVVNGYAKTETTRDGRPFRPYRLSAPEFEAEEWVKFYPKLSQVLLSYDNKYFVAAKNDEYFKELLRQELERVHPYSVRMQMKYGEEKEFDTAFGHIKSVRTTYGVYDFIDDKFIQPYNALFPQLGNVWSDSLKPLFPDCKINLDEFLTQKKNTDLCLAACTRPIDDTIQSRIDGAKRQQQANDAEAARRREEEAKRKEEEKRREEARTAFVDSIVGDPQKIIDGMKGHCVSNWWIDHNLETLRQKISTDAKSAFQFQRLGSPVSLRLEKCSSTFRLRFPEQIATLKRMDYYSKGRYLRNIVGKITQKFHIDTTWSGTIPGGKLSYTFTPTDIFEFNGNTGVIGDVLITVTPTLQESTKITLTIGQLRRLVKEASEDDPSMERGFRATVEWMKEKYDEMNARLFNGKLGECNFEIFTTGLGSQGNILGKFSIAGEHIYVSRRTRRMYFSEWSGGIDKTNITHDNFVELCKPTIKLNGNYSGTEHVILGTLVHEMCHYFNYMDGWSPRQAHGREFRSIAAVVSSRSDGEFTVQRLATAEEMKEYDLDDEFKAKNARRLENKKSDLSAVLIYKSDHKIELTLTKSSFLCDKILDFYKKKPETVIKGVCTDDPEIIDFLFQKRYTTVSRKWRYWNIEDKPWIDELNQKVNMLQLGSPETGTYGFVAPRGDGASSFVAETDDDVVEILPGMNLGLCSPID